MTRIYFAIAVSFGLIGVISGPLAWPTKFIVMALIALVVAVVQMACDDIASFKSSRLGTGPRPMS
jgi:hypothetical protein